jgi:sulfur carrier protein
MNIYVNNVVQVLPVQSSITDALGAINITAQKGIAIAVNNEVVPRAEWEIYSLQPDDKITLIRATQGG